MCGVSATAMMLSELKDVLMSVYMLKNEELTTVEMIQ
jgi:hypothetical protein